MTRVGSEDPLRIAVIIASTREGRVGPTVAQWVESKLSSSPTMTWNEVDLLHCRLPQHITDRPDERTIEYGRDISQADGYVFVTPEYNHGYPANLKQAIDLLDTEWHGKVAAFVSYGGAAGGLRAVEQLRQVLAELHVATVRDTVSLHRVRSNIDQHGRLIADSHTEETMAVMLDRLGWWTEALRLARRSNGYP